MTAAARSARDIRAHPYQPGVLARVLSDRTFRDMARLRVLQLQPSPAAGVLRHGTEVSVEGRLYDALARAKVLTSQVAMHLDRTWRAKLFGQLDALHDIAEWEHGDVPIQGASFATFLRAIIALNPDRRPGLGLTSAGCLLGAWTTGQDRLTLEFLPNGHVRWLISCYDDDQVERAAGETSVARLSAVLEPYRPSRWFGHYARQSAS